MRTKVSRQVVYGTIFFIDRTVKIAYRIAPSSLYACSAGGWLKLAWREHDDGHTRQAKRNSNDIGPLRRNTFD